MALTRTEQTLILAAYYRGGSQDDRDWTSNTDQILTLSLYYTGNISYTDCSERFSKRSYIQKLYDEAADPEEHPWGKLTDDLDARYRTLIDLLEKKPDLIEGGGNVKTPALPTYTACRLTDSGLALARSLVDEFPRKPDFPKWPDKRTMPNGFTD